MTPTELKGNVTPRDLLRLLHCIRLDEVAVLQGAPVIGALFAISRLDSSALWALAVLVAGNACMVAHVFAVNDLAGIEGDARDPRRAGRTFIAKGANTRTMRWLAVLLLVAALLLFGVLNACVAGIGLAIAVLSALYSLPPVSGKGVPLLSSFLHLIGGILHFLLGFAVFLPVTGTAVAIGCFFGLVFAAGHLSHETRDHAVDQRNGIRTNAVAFGKRRGFLVSMTMFAVAYGVLAVLGLCGRVPVVLAVVAGVALVLHLLAARRAWRAGLGIDALSRLQRLYRGLHAAIGIAILITVPVW